MLIRFLVFRKRTPIFHFNITEITLFRGRPFLFLTFVKSEVVIKFGLVVENLTAKCASEKKNLQIKLVMVKAISKKTHCIGCALAL